MDNSKVDAQNKYIFVCNDVPLQVFDTLALAQDALLSDKINWIQQTVIKWEGTLFNDTSRYVIWKVPYFG